ncbi:aminodeoxychorismate lyase [Halioglobus maricola]|uniref:aminodeoxychorismate lyase n=1 Tax=Halioglobus maricola TaxID=2601894 RepID=UPI001478BA0A|nr:aminodeoxychorismate lyase [Halioglobus maricola]
MATGPSIWIDGSPAEALPLPDRGLDFGDGLFETMLVHQGSPLLLDYHWQRLTVGLQTLGFPDTFDHARACLEAACHSLASHPWVALRLTVTRGGAPRGYAPPADAEPRVVITAAPLSQDRRELAAPARIDWAELRWSSQPALAGLKHLNRLEQVMAAREAQRQGLDEVLVMDQSGNPCSVSAGNIFLASEGRLHTPALELCGVAGTRRRFVLEQVAPALGIPAEEGVVTREQILGADELFYCNSLRGLQSVAALGSTEWQSFPLCEALHQQYWKSLKC